MAYHKIGFTLVLICALGGIDRVHAQDVLVTELEQVSALKGYLHAAKAGYRIGTDGLHLIGDIKGGELNLHRVFFGSLTEVDEAVLHDPEVGDAFAEAAATNRLLDQALTTYAASGWLQPQEVQYMAAVRQQVYDDGRANVGALETLLREGVLSMTDGERLQHIRDQRGGIHARYVGVTAYVMGIGGLITARIKEQLYLGTLKKWYGLQ